MDTIIFWENGKLNFVKIIEISERVYGAAKILRYNINLCDDILLCIRTSFFFPPALSRADRKTIGAVDATRPSGGRSRYANRSKQTGVEFREKNNVLSDTDRGAAAVGFTFL